MNKKLCMTLTLCALASLPIQQALASDSPWSAGAALGQSYVKMGCDAAHTCDKSDSGFKLYGDYTVNPNFAVEAAYVELGEASESNLTNEIFSAKTSGVAAYGIGVYPMEKLSLFAKLGLSSLTTKVSTPTTGNKSNSNTNIAWGFGAAYALTDRIAVNAVWDLFKTQYKHTTVIDDTNGIDFVSVGLNYRF